jgi:uncharacterized protein (TIGR02118 family)
LIAAGLSRLSLGEEMIKAITMWKLPANVSEADFERWYNEKHVPEVRRAPGLVRYITSKVIPERAGPDSYYRIAEFCFNSLADMDHAMASPEWKGAVADAGQWIASPIRCVFEPTQQIPSER